MSDTIIYVENGLNGGGSAESLIQLLSVIDRTRYRPVCVFTSIIPQIERVRAIGVEVVELHSWYFSRADGGFISLLSWLASATVVYGSRLAPHLALALDRWLTRSLRGKLAKIIRRERAVLVHTNNNPHRDLWAIEAAADAGVPCIAHVRSFHGMGFCRPRAEVINAHATEYIAYSRSIAEYWTERGLAAERVNIVHNAIGRIQAEAADLSAICGIPEDVPAIGIVGRIIPDRGHDYLLEAMPILRQRVPGVRLLVIGGGDPASLQSLSQLARRLGCEDVVMFLGHRPDAREIIAALDALVFPYTIEPFGRTLLEAWQLRVPVVLSDVGHIADVASDGETALLTPLRPPAIADAIGRVLTDEPLRQRLIENGAKVCSERFSIESHGAAIQAIYDRVLHGAVPEQRAAMR